MEFKELFSALYYCNRYVKEVPNPIYSKGRFYKKKKKIIAELISNKEKYGITYTIDSVETNSSSLDGNQILIGMTIIADDAEFQAHQEYDNKLKKVIGEVGDDVPRAEFKPNDPEGIVKNEQEFIGQMKIINDFFYSIKYPGNKNLRNAYVFAEYSFPRFAFSPVNRYHIIKFDDIDNGHGGSITEGNFIKWFQTGDKARFVEFIR